MRRRWRRLTKAISDMSIALSRTSHHRKHPAIGKGRKREGRKSREEKGKKKEVKEDKGKGQNERRRPRKILRRKVGRRSPINIRRLTLIAFASMPILIMAYEKA